MTVTTCDSRLRTYFDRVHSVARTPLSPAATVRRVTEAARELASGEVALDDEARRIPAEGYGRHLLHRDPEGFVVIAMVWPPGYEGLAHDHGTWGVVACVEGQVEVIDYEREDDGSDDFVCVLNELTRTSATPGAVAQVLPPHRDFHRIRNLSKTEPAITIHTYGCEIERCRVVDADGRVSFAEPQYTNETNEPAATLPSAEEDCLRRIVDDHELVQAFMQRIRTHTEGLRADAPTAEWDRLERMLGDFRTLLKRHFEAEEREEFFGTAATLDAQSRALVARLATQHRAFLAQIEGILADLDPLKREGRRLSYIGGELENLWCNLRWHDAVESGFLGRLRARKQGVRES